LLASNAKNEPLAALTPREREVLEQMAEGRSNAAISQRLYLSESAVAKHTASIFGKLGLAPSDDDNRRVMAVLAYLNSRGAWPVGSRPVEGAPGEGRADQVRIRVSHDVPAEAVAGAARVLRRRPASPALSGLLLEAGDELSLSALDYDVSARAEVDTDVSE